MRTGYSVRRQRFEQDALPHLTALWQTALWLTLRQSHAENLVVETMARAYRLWHVSDDTVGSKARLFRILTQEYYGPEKGMRLTVRPPMESHSASPSDRREHRLSALDRSDDRRVPLLLSGISDVSLKGAIARLRPQSRLVMILLFRERFSYAEIAYITDLEETSVKTILRRLRRQVPLYLAEHAEATAETDSGSELTHRSVRLEGATEAAPEPSGPGWELPENRKLGQE